MRSSYVEPTSMGLVLAALQPANRLVFEVMLATGLRVGDVLGLRTEQVERQRFTVRESKTGKTRRVYIPRELQLRLLGQAGRLYCFEGRTDWRRHRTRQAVWKDCNRVARFFQSSGAVPKRASVSPHSARKVYAVEEYRRTGDLDAVRRKLNHDPAHVATTLVYALSDKLTPEELKAMTNPKRRGRRRCERGEEAKATRRSEID